MAIMEFKITFVGICLFLGVANGPRTVIIPDLSSGDDVHGNHIQAHEATLRVPRESVVLKGTTWPYTEETIKNVVYWIFPLRHQQLTLSGVGGAPPLAVTAAYQCRVPHIEEQCPAHDVVRPTSELKREAVAWMELDAGTLNAVESDRGSVSSEYTRQATTETVTITGRSDTNTWTIVTKQDAAVVIVNAPVEDEIVPNHFLAYYRLLVPSSCCTNIPFPYKRKGCAAITAKQSDIAGTRDPEVSTVACSNSNYP